jgi:hypothetical protein
VAERCLVDRILGNVHRCGRRVPYVHFFLAALSVPRGARGGQYREILTRRFARGPDHCFGLDERASLAEQPQW